MDCGCGGKCHCMLGEISSALGAFEEAYHYGVRLTEKMAVETDPVKFKALEDEYVANWAEIEGWEEELGQTLNEFLDYKEYNEWYFRGWYYENKRIYGIAR